MYTQRLDFFERLLQVKPVFDRLCQVAESQLLQAAETGYQLQHHKITKGRRSRDWNADADALIALFGNKIVGTAPLLSVAQAEKIIGKDEIKQFVRTNEGGNKIVPMASILNEVSINCSEFN